MTTIYHLTADEITPDFLKSLKTLYKGLSISITVEENIDETEYLLSSPANRKMLEKSITSEFGYEFTSKEFSNLNKDLASGTIPDISKLRKVKLK